MENKKRNNKYNFLAINYMNQLKLYNSFAMAFIINALIVSSIGTISVETRLGIEESPTVPKTNSNWFQQFSQNFFYMLRIIPYKFAHATNLLSKKGTIPEWIKSIYTFIITFIIALLVYHIFLFLLGYKKFYEYFFGNMPTLTKLNIRRT
jgi:predicted PurR-regulated permease PerM